MLTNEAKIYTVSQLNATTRFLLEDTFPLILVAGEISNFTKPSSGHIYFSLKDEYAQIRCAMFRNHNSRLDFQPENGMHVLVKAQVSLYEPRGDYQLIIHEMELAGDGLLRRKFEELKKKLAVEGLFASKHKKTIPKFPNCIGVITSSTGAAIRDILSVLKRRCTNIPIIIYPSQVQGTEAAEQIVTALQIANQRAECDVLIVARGGGSLEDLWPFNEEIVARAIYKSTIPIVSGVGHEIDFTIADLVADIRAATPSAAAELVGPNTSELLNTIEYIKTKLTHNMYSKLHNLQLTLQNISQRLQHPGRRLQTYSQQLDNLEQRLALGIKNLLQHKKAAVTNLARALDAISPLATLNRGYAIVTKTTDNKILRNAQEVNIGDQIDAKLQKGSLRCTVDKTTS